MLRVGSLELDLINRTAKRGARPIDLLPSEFRLLKYMMQRGGQLLTRAKLFQDVWHYKFLPETNLVDVHMGRLRRKVNGPNEAPMIRTVRGAGSFSVRLRENAGVRRKNIDKEMIMKDKYDVLVVGGGAAGVGAAVGAAKTGARVGWLKRRMPGRAGTMRNVLTYCGLYTLGEQPRQAVAGVADEIMAKLRCWGAVTLPTRHRGVFVIFDPEAAKRALDEVCAAAGVDILLHTFRFRRDREDNAVARLRFADHSGETPTGGKSVRRRQRRLRPRLLRWSFDAIRQQRSGQPRHSRDPVRWHCA